MNLRTAFKAFAYSALCFMPAFAMADDVVTVSGTKLLLNGQPYEARIAEYVGTAGVPSWLESGGPDGKGFLAYLRAYEHLKNSGSTSFDYARSYYGANTIEYKVSQSGFDTEDPTFSAADHQAYINEIKDATALARQKGFIVILATMRNKIAENNAQIGFATASTERVDVALADMYKNDRGVIIEVDNEPWFADRRLSLSDLWQAYLHGGPGKKGMAQVGIQEIIDKMRATGAQNLILVEPYFHYGFADFPGGLTDPGNNMAWSIHPYFQQAGTTPKQWDAYFGDFALTHPVVVTEWSQGSGPVGKLTYDWCTGPETLDLPRQYLKYFKAHGINGVAGWAFDMPGTILVGFDGPATTMTACGAKQSNVGEWIREYFAGTLQ